MKIPSDTWAPENVKKNICETPLIKIDRQHINIVKQHADI